MNNILLFGESEGKTFEWLFFNRPWYAEWIYHKNIHRKEYLFSEEAGDYFEELFTRASCLTGTCPYCKERPITYMGLSRLCTGTLGHVDFFCDECDYTGGSMTGYYAHSFFMPYKAPRCDQLRLPKLIKNRLIGHGRLTQEKMEAFFHAEGNFVHATPEFFTAQLVTA